MTQNGDSIIRFDKMQWCFVIVLNVGAKCRPTSIQISSIHQIHRYRVATKDLFIQIHDNLTYAAYDMQYTDVQVGPSNFWSSLLM